MDRDKIDELSRAATTNEIENYRTIYGSDKFVRDGKSLLGHIKLNREQCVILPYFEPIPNGRSEEYLEATLSDIQKLLKEKFYCKVEGKTVSYQFKECDRRWRHVGRWNGQVVLFDLADLEKYEISQDEHNEYVSQHIEALKERYKKE